MDTEDEFRMALIEELSPKAEIFYEADDKESGEDNHE